MARPNAFPFPQTDIVFTSLTCTFNTPPIGFNTYNPQDIHSVVATAVPNYDPLGGLLTGTPLTGIGAALIGMRSFLVPPPPGTLALVAIQDSGFGGFTDGGTINWNNGANLDNVTFKMWQSFSAQLYKVSTIVPVVPFGGGSGGEIIQVGEEDTWGIQTMKFGQGLVNTTFIAPYAGIKGTTLPPPIAQQPLMFARCCAANGSTVLNGRQYTLRLEQQDQGGLWHQIKKYTVAPQTSCIFSYYGYALLFNPPNYVFRWHITYDPDPTVLDTLALIFFATGGQQ